jgi:hypothetical protein
MHKVLSYELAISSKTSKVVLLLYIALRALLLSQHIPLVLRTRLLYQKTLPLVIHTLGIPQTPLVVSSHHAEVKQTLIDCNPMH